MVMNIRQNPWKLWLLSILFLGLAGCLKDERADLPNLREQVEAYPELSLYLELLNKTGLVSTIEGSTLTLFAPDNNAINAFLNEFGLNSVSEIPTDAARFILLYHMVTGEGTRDNIASGYYATSCACGPDNYQLSVLIEIASGLFQLNGTTHVKRPDIQARNGIIHIVDSMMSLPTIQGFLEQNSAFDNMRQLLELGGVYDRFGTSDTYTVMALPNDGFEPLLETYGATSVEEIPGQKINELANANVAPGNYWVRDIENGAVKPLDTDLAWRITTGSGTVILNDSINVVIFNIQATDGVLHFVSSLIDPE